MVPEGVAREEQLFELRRVTSSPEVTPNRSRPVSDRQVLANLNTLQVVGNKSVENLAEREGFYYRHFLQVSMNPTFPR
jgi:hypothetical protein